MKLEYMHLGTLKTAIVKALWRNQRKTRDELIEELGYARTTIYDNLAKGDGSLKGRGIVEKQVLKSDGKKGRPNAMWFLTKSFITDMEGELFSKY